MAYNEMTSKRVRQILQAEAGLTAKKMFGGIGFLVNGNMACGVTGDELMVRVNPDEYEDLIQQPHVRVFDFTGRPMKGWITIGPGGFVTQEDLEYWVGLGLEFARSLPPK